MNEWEKERKRVMRVRSLNAVQFEEVELGQWTSEYDV